MLDGMFQDGEALVKEGAVFLKVGERVRAFLRDGDLYIGGSRDFLFVPDNLYRCCRNISLFIVNGYHKHGTTGVHRKLVGNWGC